MRPRTLLVLLVLVLGLGAFIFFVDRKLPSSEERSANAKKVLALKKDDVTAITVTAGASRLELARVGPPPADKEKDKEKKADADLGAGAPPAEWRIVQPLAARADAMAVSGLLDSLTGLEKTRTLEKVDLKAVGLDKPRATVRLKVAGTGGKGGETVLLIGAAVPTGGSLIAGLAGSRDAYVVPDSILTELQKKPGDWRDKRVVSINRDQVERLTLVSGASGGQRLLLAKRGDQFWIESPIVDRADRDKVDALLTDVSGLSAETFLDPPTPPLAQLGLEPPKATIEAVLAGNAQPVRIELGASHPGPPPPPSPPDPTTGQPAPPPAPAGDVTTVRAGGQLFDTRTQLAEAAARPAADWRSPLLSGLEVHQVESATVRDDKGAVALTRSGTDWKRGATTISYLPVSDLLFALTEAKADRLLTAAEAQPLGAGAGKPVLTFELKGGAAGNETLTLYPALTGTVPGVPARANGRDVVLLLPAAKLKEIQDRLDAVRTAKPLAAEKKADAKGE